MDEDHDPLRRRVLASLLAGVPAGLTGSALAGAPPERPRRKPGGNTWFCLRQNGVPQQAGWIAGAPADRLRGLIGAHGDEVLEVCVADNFRDVPPSQFARVFQPRLRGIIGIEIEFRDEVLRLAPTRMVAANLGFKRALERVLERHGASRAAFDAEGRLRSFSARQYLLPPGAGARPVDLFRGGTVVDPTDTAAEARDRAAVLADGIGAWMQQNLGADGSLPYKYWPSRGEISPADNAIRRFLTCSAIGRWGAFSGSAAMQEAGRRNLRFNMARYFRDLGDGRGVIAEPRWAKLGAAALAGLAILDNDAADEFAGELALLAAGVDSLADDDERGFRTFFYPASRDGQNWNFYSGEALLFWAEARRRGLPFAPSAERCRSVFERYRDTHRRNRNPAFVPWHTQACASLFAQTGDRAYAAFVLEMNDWLLPMQQWDGVAPDLRGRFYDPQRPEFGPPHASSTAVYLEGLADAAPVARALGESRRAERYERAVRRGLRALRQLQFRDRRDMFYISRPERVRGALRAKAYDNAVRVDSAGHALAAAVKILRPMQFGTG